LPNNRRMSLEIYDDYIAYILLQYSSQIVYLHLSEHRAPHAVDSFLTEMDHHNFFFPNLKAITIKDVPVHIYNSLIHSFLPLCHLKSLSIDLNNNHYHYWDYNKWNDIDFVVPVLNSLSQLCSFYLRISSNYDKSYMDNLSVISPSITTHLNLHTFSIDQCSRQLFVELLGNNRLPILRIWCIPFPK